MDSSQSPANVELVDLESDCLAMAEHMLAGTLATSNDPTRHVVPPSDVSWFINPMNTIVISTINHSEMGVIGTNLAN